MLFVTFYNSLNMNKQIILKSRPIGEVKVENFDILQVDVPKADKGELLVKAKYISVDPYMRGRMSDGKTNIPAFELNKPIIGGTVSEILESKQPGYKKGDLVVGPMAWQEIQSVQADKIALIDGLNVPPEYYLGILGMPGLTAYFGLLDIGKPQKGETVVISGAAGAVGLVVGQIARIRGCRVVGIAGTDEKIKYLKEILLFDEVINYKWERNLQKAVELACPNGTDIYFDNIGGPISDAVITTINKGARIIICGQISQYNAIDQSVGPSPQIILMKKSALMQGFSFTNYSSRYPEGFQALSTWLKDKKIIYKQTIIQGFENLPQALIGLFHGTNTGKLIVEV